VEDLVAGTVLGDRYELHEVVGAGGMASVWRAHDRILDRPVAVKVLHARLAEDPAFLERFKAEAMASARLTHPNIVNVFDTGADGATVYIVMEMFEGETLRDLLANQGPLEPEHAASITIQVLNGLQFAHEHDLIHRDVKPANVLVAPDGRVKVTDFGIAKAAYGGTAEPTTTGKVLGSVPYLAPEQVEGTPLDARADVYATGAMLYELLTGRPPFQAETDIAAAMLRLTQDPIPPRAIRSGIPRQLDSIVMRALARDREGRFVSAAEMAASLSRFEAGSTAPQDVIVPEHEPDHRGGFFRSWMVVPLLAILTAAVVIVIAVAAGLINSPLDNGPEGTTGTGTTGGSATTGGGNPGSRLRIQEPLALDPFGDGAEHDEDLSLALDGDPATFWQTEGYHSPTLDKDGVGIAFDLGQSEEVTGFRLQTPLPGWEFELRVGDDLEALATASGPKFTAAGTMRESIPPVTGRYVVVWITTAVPAPDGENRAEVGEFSALGGGGGQ
jgi:serine/threonine-protein kinase